MVLSIFLYPCDVFSQIVKGVVCNSGMMFEGVSLRLRRSWVSVIGVAGIDVIPRSKFSRTFRSDVKSNLRLVGFF